MPFGKKVFLSFLITFLFCLPFVFFVPNRSRVLPLETQSKTVPNVTARVGEYLIRILSGWASPYADVFLNGQGTARKTTADANGYFEFLSIPVKKTYGELCLTSQDVNHLPTLPVCLPGIPPREDIEIIGVLLPPTITLDKAKMLPGEPTKASGMTFPGSDLDVYLFEKRFPSGKTTLPLKYSTKTNKNGFYEFSLPTFNVSENRLFVVSHLSGLSILSNLSFPSPKSNTLRYLINKQNWLWIIPILLSILGYLSYLFFVRRKEEPSALMIPQDDLVKSPAYCDTDLKK